MNEAIVRRLWLAGGWPPGALRTIGGAVLRVVYPGRRGHGAGPDLLDAIVVLPDGQLLHGDVELHVRASDWRAHGHSADARYARVVLHVVWRDDVGAPLDRPDGGVVPHTIALDQLDETLLFERLGRPSGRDESYHDWLRVMADPERTAFLERLGDEQLTSRAARFAADLHALGGSDALHRGLLDALGYSQNRAAFRQLAELVSPTALALAGRSSADRDEAEANALALLVAAAGLLDEDAVAHHPIDGRAVVEAYRRRVDPAFLPGRLRPGVWEVVGVRPANRPLRRLAALARLGASLGDRSLDEAVTGILLQAEPGVAVRGLLDLVRVRGLTGGPADYWAHHHDFGRRLPGGPMALVGEERARAILANVLLPFCLALADARNDARLSGAVWATWRIAPPCGRNWIIDEMRPVLGRVAVTSARREQGAIELYRRCCAERRCLTCPASAASARVAVGSVAR